MAFQFMATSSVLSFCTVGWVRTTLKVVPAPLSVNQNKSKKWQRFNFYKGGRDMIIKEFCQGNAAITGKRNFQKHFGYWRRLNKIQSVRFQFCWICQKLHSLIELHRHNFDAVQTQPMLEKLKTEDVAINWQALGAQVMLLWAFSSTETRAMVPPNLPLVV